MRISSSPWVVAACVAFTVTACASTSSDPGDGDRTTTQVPGKVILGHVNALGVDPADGTLFAATKLGVFRVEDRQAELVADRAQETTGFVVVGEGQFLAGGHPDPDENLPPSLGLIESSDAGETWQPLSLLGEADLHAIDVSGATVYAYDSTMQSLIVTSDGQRWSVISQLLAMRDIATDPTDPDTVYVVTDGGELLRSTDGDEPSPVYDAPSRLALVDWQPDGPMVAATLEGDVLVSDDGETVWSRVGTLDAPVEALDAVEGHWYAATAAGIYESTDDGASWTLVLRRDG